MKNNLSTQPTAGANTMTIRDSSLPCIDLLNKIPECANKFLPETASATFNLDIPIKKIYGNDTELNPLFNILLKQVAARLSEIELALDCYDVSVLRFCTRDLRDLFLDNKMTALYKLAVQIEELDQENQFQEVKDLLRAIKKIIGQVVKHRKQPPD